MENRFKQGLFYRVLLFSIGFIVIIGLILVILNLYFPDVILKRYLSKSKKLARHLSQTIGNVNIFSRNKQSIKRIIRLNFPDEENIIQIAVKNKSGKTTYEDNGEGESGKAKKKSKFRHNFYQSNRINNRMRFFSEKGKKKSLMYYRVSSPIVRNGEIIGSVFVKISKKRLFNKIEINKTQLARIIFLGSFGFFIIVSLSFLVSLRFFIKYKKSEEQAGGLKRLAYVGEISSGLAHEIRNPLNTMSINIQLLKEKLDGQQEKGLLRKVELLENAKNHAANVLNQFLDFAKYKQKNFVNFNVLNVVGEIFSMLEYQLVKKKIHFVNKTNCESLMIKADPGEIKQVLLNLVLNSMDALTDDGNGKIEIELEGRKKNLHIVLKDNGAGMDEFTLKNLYTPFFTKKAEGTGLGLAVVKRIVDEYKGEIECSSREGEGTEFMLTINEVITV